MASGNESGTARRGFDVLADALIEADVQDAFCLLGQANLFPLMAAADRGVRVHSARHEFGAIAMATGYAHASGRTGFATVSKGPSFVNGLTALVSAVRDRLPLVLYAGATPERATTNNQHIHQAAMVAPTGARFLACHDPASLRVTAAAAFEIAQAERVPVVLSVPYDLVEAPEVVQTGSCDARPRVPEVPAEPEPATVERIAALLEGSSRPVILAGQGAVLAGARSLLEDLAAATNALVATTLPASGFFQGNEFSVGHAGGYSPPGRHALLEEADLLVAFGASLNPFTMDQGRIFPRATVVHCDHDPAAIGHYVQPDIALHAEVGAAAKAILAALGPARAARPRFRTPDVRARIVATSRSQDVATSSIAEGVDPRHVVRVIDDLLPGPRLVTLGVGYFGHFVGQAMALDAPGTSYFFSQGFATVGLGLASAIGHAVARPDVPGVVFVGDGGLLMSLTELETAGRLRPDLTIVVMNDRAYGAEVQNAWRIGRDPALVQWGPPPFARVAAALGIEAMTVPDLGAMAGVAEFLARTIAPRLIDVHINPRVS